MPQRPSSTVFYSCKKCPYKTTSLYSAKIHILKKTQPSPQPFDYQKPLEAYTCRFCPFHSLLGADLINHLNTLHKTISRTTSVTNHSQTCRPVDQLQCNQCPYRTRWRLQLTAHRLFEHEGKEDLKWFVCEQCNFKTKTKGCLKTHIFARHMPPECIKWYECDHCAYRAKQLGVLKTHIMAKHTKAKEVKWFECDHCAYEDLSDQAHREKARTGH